MAQTIKLKRSAVQGVIPTTSQLELGEVAINTYDGKMYIKKNVGGTESIIEVGANAAFTPAGSDGQLQFNNGGALGATAQVYYDDVNNRLGVLTSTPSYDLDVAGTAGVSKLQLDTSGTPAGSTMGELVWNTDSETADLVLNNGVVLQLGQENHFYVKAGEAISNGDVVYASGAVGNSGKIEVSKYIANGTIEERRVVGIATQDIALGEFGYVTSLGAVRGISTDGSALTTPENWNIGDILYASPNVAGELTKTLPVAPNQAIAIAFVVAEHASNGILQVRAYDLGYHIEELHDVHTSSVAGNDILAWSATNSRWENTDIPTLVDNRYVNVTGDTMTGALTITAGASVTGELTVGTRLIGGIGARTTSGTLDWNDSSNARSGSGYTLLLGTHTNGPGVSGYYHPFTFEYNQKDGTGNMNQFAFDYASSYGPFFRTRYSGSWTGWTKIWNSSNDGSGSGLDADTVDGYHASSFLLASNFHDYYVTSAAFNTSDGVLTLTRNDGGTVTVDLDGRYYNTTDSDSRYVNVTGDTMTGNLTVNAELDSRVLRADTNDVGEVRIGGIVNTSGNSYIRESITFSRNTDQITWDNTNSNWVHAGGTSTDWSMIAHNSGGMGIWAGASDAVGWTKTNAQFDTDHQALYINASTLQVSVSENLNVGGSITSGNISVSGSVGVTNIVTNKVVKFNGSILDDSNITDTGSAITLGSNTTVSGNLTVSSGNPLIKAEATTTNWAGLELAAGGNQADYIFFKDDTAERARITVLDNNEISFYQGSTPTLSIRLDASRNLLVGNTVVDPASGFSDQKGFGYAAATGKVQIATTANDAAIEIGKNNANDGSLVAFRKQGTVVGSIGTKSGGLNVINGDTGLGISGTYDIISPINGSGDTRDAAISIGGTGQRFKNLYLSGTVNTTDIATTNITLTGYLRGPSTFTIDPAAHGDNTGTVVIAGNLQVDGTTTTINSTTVQVDDKNIELAVGSTNKAAADGAGITIDCGTDTDATLLYDGVNDWWEFNKPLESTRFLQTGSVASNFYAIQLSRSGTGTTTPDLWGTNNTLVIGNSSSNPVISIDSSSRVGIGTSSPTRALEVAASGNDGIKISSGNALIGATSGSDAQLLYWNGTNSYYGRSSLGGSVAAHYFRSAGVDKFIVDSTGAEVLGILGVNSTFALNGEEATLATTTQTQIASFSATTYGGGKFVITAKDGVNRHICELLVTHDGTTAVATQYGSVTTASDLATYDVDISGGNVRILATSASANSTEYKVAETLMEA